MTTTTITGAGAHASAATDDRIPALKTPFTPGTKGYLTPDQIVQRGVTANIAQAHAAILDDLVTDSGIDGFVVFRNGSSLTRELYGSGGIGVLYGDGHDADPVISITDAQLVALLGLSPSDGDLIEWDSASACSVVNKNALAITSTSGTEKTLANWMDSFPLYIGTNTTITVAASGADYTTIPLALASIAGKRIAADVIVTISVGDGTYILSSAITIEHPDGAQIRIIGNTGAPTSCVLQASTAISCFYIGDGCAIDQIDGFLLEHTTPAARASTAGVLADRNSSVKLGTSVRATGWYWGYFARRGAYMEARSCYAASCGDAGFHALDGAMIDATSSTSENNNDSANSLGSGYVAERASIIADGATATGNWLDGFQAIQNGGIKATGALAQTSTTGSGFSARESGTINADGSDSNGNARYGQETDGSSEINGTVTNTGAANTLGTSFKRFEVDDTVASARNWLRIKGSATGSPVIIDTQGSDTNRSVSVRPAGTGSLQVLNSADQATQEVLRLEGDRATPAANDQIYTGYQMSDAAGTQVEAARLGVYLSDATAGSVDAVFQFINRINGTITNTLRVDGSAIYPATDDGMALGLSTKQWADLFLASGGVINFNAGDVTVTHSANTLTFAGASSGYAFDSIIKLADGSAAAPSLTFTNDASLDTGLYRATTDTIGIARAGSFAGQFGATFRYDGGFAVSGNTVVGARVTGFTTSSGTGNKNASGINVDTITASDANIRALGAWVKAINDALTTHGLIGT